jgi:integrase
MAPQLEEEATSEAEAAVPEGRSQEGQALGARHQIQDPEPDECAVQSRHSLGALSIQPDFRPRPQGGSAAKFEAAKAPDILELAEMRPILPELSVRERALISLDMVTGIRRGELAGLKWKDIDFGHLLVNVIRSVVDSAPASARLKLRRSLCRSTNYTAEDLQAWYRLTPYRDPEDWVFASDDPRLCEKRGKQPLWLSKIMQYHIQPLVKRLGIAKRVSWQTFRSTFTSLLTANKENVKVVQELLRHASSKITRTIAQSVWIEIDLN